jgi:cysteine desulfuration protein SufE
MSLVEKQQRLIAKYGVIEDAHQRLTAVMSFGKRWPTPREEERIDANRVQGCMSQVWLGGTMEDGRCRFRVVADSALVQGLAAIHCELYDGETPAEVAAFEPELLAGLEFEGQLSPTRLNGLANVRRVIRTFAESHRED